MRGLPEFGKVLSETSKQIIVGKESCKTTTVVLLILSVLVAGGAASLIAISGGPNHLQLFVPGAILSALTLGLVIAGIVFISKALLLQRALEAKYSNDAAQKIEPSEILNEMNKSGKELIVRVLGQMSPEQRQEFLAWAFDQKNISDDVLHAFSRFPDDLNALDVNQLDSKYVAKVVEGFDPMLEQNKEGRTFLEKWCKQGLHDIRFMTFAKFPVTVARLELYNLNTNYTLTTTTAMNDKQKALFLQEMASGCQINQSKTGNISTIVKNVIQLSLTQDFADRVSQVELNQNQDDSYKVLQQMAQWPTHIAELIYGDKHNKLDEHNKFHIQLQSLLESLIKKDLFIKTASQKVTEPHLTLRRLAKKEIEFSKLTTEIYSLLPDAIVRAKNKLNSTEKKYLDEALKRK